MPQIVCRIVWIPSFIAVVVMVVLFGRSPAAMPAPGAMEHYEAGDKSFTLQIPSQWARHGSGGGGVMMEVNWTPTPDVYFSIGSDLAGSLMADIAKSTGSMGGSLSDTAGEIGSSGTGQTEEPKEEKRRSPLRAIHEQANEAFAQKREGYQEIITTESAINGQEAMITDFSFKRSSLFATHEIVGKRTTMLTNDRRYTILYYYDKARQAELEPLFKQMLTSVKLGTPGG